MHPHHQSGARRAGGWNAVRGRLADPASGSASRASPASLRAMAQRDLDGLRLALGVAGIGLREEAGRGEGEALHGVGEPRLRLRLGLGAALLRWPRACAVRLGLGAAASAARCACRARAGAAEVVVEQEWLGAVRLRAQ